MKWAPALALLSGVGCGPGYDLVLGPTDPDIDRAAILLYGADGAFLESTGLGALSTSAPLTVVVPADVAVESAVLVGWRAVDLRDAPSLDVMAESPLRPATPPDPRLPAPRIAQRLSLDGRDPSSLSAPIPLTVDWLEPCPSLGAVTTALSCALESCNPEVLQVGCLVNVDPTDVCVTGPPLLRIDGTGALAGIEGEGSEACLPIAAPDGALAAIECQGSQGTGVEKRCEIDLIGPSPALRLTAETAALFTITPVTKDDNYLSDIVTVGAEVVVATHDGRVGDWLCNDPAPDRLEWIDPGTLRSVRSQAAPPCVTQLLPDADGFLAIYGVGPKTIGFFDAGGSETTRLVVPELLHIKLAARAGNTVLLGGVRSDSVPLTFELSLLDLSTGAATSILEPFEELVGLELTDGLAVAIDDDNDVARFYDRRSPAEPYAIGLGVGTAEIRVLHGMLYHHPASDLFLVGARARFGGFTIFEDRRVTARAVTFGAPMGGHTAIAWPNDPRLLVVGLNGDGNGFVGVALVDPTVPRFIPGITPVNAGSPPTQMTAVGDAIVAIHAHSAEVSVIRSAD